MPQYHRQVGRRSASLDLIQFGVANAAGADADEHLAVGQRPAQGRQTSRADWGFQPAGPEPAAASPSWFYKTYGMNILVRCM